MIILLRRKQENIKNIFMKVLKMNETFKGLKQHDGKQMMTPFPLNEKYMWPVLAI